MPSKQRFLLIGNRPEEEWSGFLQAALEPFGILDIMQTEDAAMKMLLRQSYDLIIVDAGGVRNPSSLISLLRARRKNFPILVVTASPTWQSAREVLKAGAVDYVGRSFDKKEFILRIQEILRSSPSKMHSPKINKDNRT